MATAFSSSDDIIEKRLNCSYESSDLEKLSEIYELPHCVQWILKHGFKRVALQFPDRLLVDASAVASKIQGETKDVVVFILGDTSYGSCCVDEVGAQHYNADCIIHYGHACLSPTTRLPVLFVFERSPLNVKDCLDKIMLVLKDVGKSILMYHTTYHHIMDEISNHLKLVSSPPVLAKLVVPMGALAAENQNSRSSTESSPDKVELDEKSKHLSKYRTLHSLGRDFDLQDGDKIEDYSVVFIGDQSCATLLNMMMTLNKCPFFTYNPAEMSIRRESLQINKALMKRYYLIERLKDANIIGIVAGTLGVSKYKQVMDHVKALIKNAGKKSYTFVVGKLNPAKLANFAEVDVYVLVACPESSLIDMSEFYRPVVTPLEVEFAFNSSREWTGEYTTDFLDILPGGPMHVEAPDTFDTDKAADVSLISNKIRSLGTSERPELSEKSGQELLLRSDALTVSSIAENAGEFLSNRSWQGLKKKQGQTPVTLAIDGTHGIAAGYQHEPET